MVRTFQNNFAKWNLLCLCHILLLFHPACGQFTSPTLNSLSLDSIGINYNPIIIPLIYWDRFNSDQITLIHKEPSFYKYKFSPKTIFPENPFYFDGRSSSYYVPRFVSDELNMIMNRPKSTAFLPVLNVAFWAAQLAAKYLLIQQKIAIEVENVLRSEQGIPIIQQLWEKNPQTATQLFDINSLQEKNTVVSLKNILELLSDNKLVKTKKLGDGDLQYFPAISRNELSTLLEKAYVDTSLSKREITKVDSFLTLINK
jgi:predicted transcriptional regulator